MNSAFFIEGAPIFAQGGVDEAYGYINEGVFETFGAVFARD